jgi:hypothetical protein
MQSISSASSNYSYLFEDIASKQVNEIRKNAILEELNTKVAMASIVADDIMMGIANNGYEMDSVIPENSTVSFHV